MNASPEEARLEAQLVALDPAALAALARRYQKLALAEGAFVRLADGAEVAIPPIWTPLVLPEAERSALSDDAAYLVAAISRLSRALLEGREPALAELVFSSLSPLEHEAMTRTYRDAEHLATARVDYLVDTHGVARALELNTTIPAMQGYSDAIAAAFLTALGEHHGLSQERIAAAIDRNGRNSDDLLAALSALYRATGGQGEPRTIAIVARPGDAQSGELDHYVRRFAARGVEALRVTPDQIRLDGTRGLADGRAVDLFYRHVFLRRLDPTADFARMLLEPTRHRIFNPPASHLELKAMLGVASAVAGGELAALEGLLSDEERGAVARRVPWTRVLRNGPSRAPDGSLAPDLVELTRHNAHALVLKRSWDYGGRGVFLGAEIDSPSSQAKLRELIGPREVPYVWNELVDHITRSGEAWVVQALVDVQPRPLIRVEDTGPVERTLYADLSAFTSLGTGASVTGGAVRASQGRIVNIQGGGGLCPLLRDEALAMVLGA